MRSIVLIALLVVTSCGGASVPDPNPNATVLFVESSGGCAQLGPNCARIVVRGDGTVEAYRITAQGSELVDSGSIDRGLVNGLHREVSSTDLPALHQRLPEGECRGCVDGVDTSMSFPSTAGVQAVMPLVFSSVDVELDRSEPLFAAAWAVYEAAQAAVDVPVVAR